METKPGYLTTEFWLTILANLVVVLNLAGVWNYMPDKYAGIIGAVVTGAYAIARGNAKQGVPYTPPPEAP